MKKIIFAVVIFSAIMMISCGGGDSSEKSGLGESCTKTSDCKTGLKCIDLVCVSDTGNTGATCTGSDKFCHSHNGLYWSDASSSYMSWYDAVLKPSGGNWSKISAKTMNWNDAKAYCANLNEDGYSDWRLPTISELRTLIENCPATETGGACKVDNNCLSSSCYSNACGGCDSASDGRYSKLGDTTEWLWSSSELSDNSGYAWHVHFSYGYVHHYHEYGYYDVRCVR